MCAEHELRLLPDGYLFASFSTMAATWPAAGAALAFGQIHLGPLDSPLPGLAELGVFDPADPLVACEWGDAMPGSQCSGICAQRLAQILWNCVDRTAGDLQFAHASARSLASVGLGRPANRHSIVISLGQLTVQLALLLQRVGLDHLL